MLTGNVLLWIDQRYYHGLTLSVSFITSRNDMNYQKKCDYWTQNLITHYVCVIAAHGIGCLRSMIIMDFKISFSNRLFQIDFRWQVFWPFKKDKWEEWKEWWNTNHISQSIIHTNSIEMFYINFSLINFTIFSIIHSIIKSCIKWFEKWLKKHVKAVQYWTCN